MFYTKNFTIGLRGWINFAANKVVLLSKTEYFSGTWVLVCVFWAQLNLINKGETLFIWGLLVTLKCPI